MIANMKKYKTPVVLTLQIEGKGDIPPGVYDAKLTHVSKKKPDGTITVSVKILQCKDCIFDGFLNEAIMDGQACEDCLSMTDVNFNFR